MKLWQWTLATAVAAATAVSTAMGYIHSEFPTKDLMNSNLQRIEQKVDLVLQYYGIKYKED